MIEIYESVGRPEFGAEVLAADDLARTFEQNGENLKRLLLQLDLGSVAKQFARPQVRFEDAKLYFARPIARSTCTARRHESFPVSPKSSRMQRFPTR